MYQFPKMSLNHINMLSKIIISSTILFGITVARTSSIDIDENSKESSTSSLRLEQCHEGCLKKVNYNMKKKGYYLYITA